MVGLVQRAQAQAQARGFEIKNWAWDLGDCSRGAGGVLPSTYSLSQVKYIK